MISVSIMQKQPLSAIKWIGILIAFLGLVFLVNAQSDLSQANFSLYGFMLMVLSGIAWAGYTILGKGSKTPLLDTSANFSKSLVFAFPLLLVYFFIELNISGYGIFLSIMSGAITSGLGYAIWYYALNGLSAIKAGVVQLLVPVIAALGGLIWIGEAITVELIIAQVVILGGIALVIFSPNSKGSES
jgi:drug/metabolite transporter (DMT)-like permease